MTRRSMKRWVFSLVSAAVAVMLAQAPGYAGKISDYEYIMRTEYASHQGAITFISQSGDYLVVSDRKIWLVDVSYSGSSITTVVHDEDGSLIDFKRLRVGDRVYVFGGGRRDNEIAAKDIFLLDANLSDSEFRDFPRNKALRTWKSEIRPGS
ncbi:MAG TPA: hypothetical protein PKM41_01425 [Deltaproteobacteria bacterium]|nr:hypothetical protein [Deltaproteobacteria bacterium]